MNQSKLSDKELVERYINGDKAAFEELYYRHNQLVAGFCSKHLDNPEKTEDAVQETFIRFIRLASHYDGRCKLTSFICGIANYVVKECNRQDQKCKVLNPKELVELSINESYVSPQEREIIEKQSARLLVTELEKLEKEFKEVIILHHLLGLPIEEVASITESSRKAVQIRLWRSVLKLECELSKFIVRPEHIEKLPEHYRECFTLYYVKQLSVRDVGKVLGLTPEKTQIRIRRGMLEFARIFPNLL